MPPPQTLSQWVGGKPFPHLTPSAPSAPRYSRLLDLGPPFANPGSATGCKDRVELLCSVAANPERQTVCAKTNSANTGRVTRTV